MKSLAELNAIKEKMKGQVGIRSEGDQDTRVVVGMATCGIAAGARPVLQTFSSLVQEKALNVSVQQTGCIGLCQYEPIVDIYRPGEEKVTYIKMDEEKSRKVFEQHLVRGIAVAEYTINNSNLANKE